MGTNGMDLTGNSWKPDSAKMGSTDTGDYFPEGYDPNDQVAFSEGMGGSQAMLGGGSREVQLPGMDFNDDGVMMGGIETASEIPAGMTFIPSSVPDGVIEMNVASSSSGKSKWSMELDKWSAVSQPTFAAAGYLCGCWLPLTPTDTLLYVTALPYEVAPVCMTFEDYFAAFSADSHPSLSVSPQTGRMDRRGGEKTVLNINCSPNGQAGEFTGNLVINLPEDNSKICYKVIAKCYWAARDGGVLIAHDGTVATKS
jgi:hypothetical protein